MTHIAKSYQISRTFLSQLLLMATLQLETLLSEEKLLLQKDHRHFDQRLLLFRLEGKCALLSLSSLLKALEYPPTAVGYLRPFFHSAGQMRPSTLLMPSKKMVFDLSDAIVALPGPIGLTSDARSPTLRKSELASDRSAATWRAHFDALEEHQCFGLGMAAERGLGLVAGSQAACARALWVADDVHACRDLFALRHHWERQAYAAMVKEHDATPKFAHAKGASNLAKRRQQDDTAPHAGEQAIALYDPRALLLPWRREAWDLCSPHGRLRTGENVRSVLLLLCDRIAALACAAMTTTRKPLSAPIDDLGVPFKPGEAMAPALRAVVPHDAWEFLVLAWHQAHFVAPAGSKHKAYPQRARAFWSACADGRLGDAFDPLKALVFDQLDSLVRASSLVAMGHSLMRPSLKSCKGQITPETVNLMLLYHNQRRYKSGKRQGKAPLELWIGKPWEAPWWELLLPQVNTEQGVSDPGTVPSRPPLHLVVNNDGYTDQQAMARGQAIVDPTGASENHRRQQGSEAAWSFHLYENSALLRAVLEWPDCTYIQW